MKFDIPRVKVEHAIAQRLVFEHFGDWRYDPGDPVYDGWLRQARRMLKHIRACERANAEAAASGKFRQSGGADER